MTCNYRRKTTLNGAKLECTPQKSLRHLVQETSISDLSAALAAKMLKLWPYEAIIVHDLQQCVGHEKHTLQNKPQNWRLKRKKIWRKILNVPQKELLWMHFTLRKWYREIIFSVSFNTGTGSSLYCFYGATLDSYQKNLLAFDSESCSSCQQLASDRCTEFYPQMHCISFISVFIKVWKMAKKVCSKFN